MSEVKQEGDPLRSGKTTLGALGALLPVGGASRDMVARPWRMKEEREIGALRERMKKNTPGEYVAAVVGAMYTQLGDAKLESMSENQRLAAVCKMHMGDVMYAYTWLRVCAIGYDLNVVIQCPQCKHKNELLTDLHDLDVKTARPDETWQYKLEDRVPIRGALAETLTLGAPTWEVMRTHTGAANISLAKAEIIRVSVRRVDQRDPFPLAPNDLDEVSKRDVEGIAASLDRFNAGPDFAIEVTCAQCATDIRTALDWGFDSFFSSSSGRTKT